MSVVDYLENVTDKETFIEFVNALVEDRSKAEKMEQLNAENYQTEGALGWQNTNIESFLQAAVVWLVDSDKNDVSWKLMAEFLYRGKIYE